MQGWPKNRRAAGCTGQRAYRDHPRTAIAIIIFTARRRLFPERLGRPGACQTGGVGLTQRPRGGGRCCPRCRGTSARQPGIASLRKRLPRDVDLCRARVRPHDGNAGDRSVVANRPLRVRSDRRVLCQSDIGESRGGRDSEECGQGERPDGTRRKRHQRRGVIKRVG